MPSIEFGPSISVHNLYSPWIAKLLCTQTVNTSHVCVSIIQECPGKNKGTRVVRGEKTGSKKCVRFVFKDIWISIYC